MHRFARHTLCALLLTALPWFAAAEARSAAAADEPAKAETGPVLVRLTTTVGDITLELDTGRAPITVANFLGYVDSGHYDGTIFHRVIPAFMIQGGGYDSGLNEKETRAPIKNEAENGLINATGTIAMARTSEIDSATSQFFINVVDNAFLDHSERSFGYAVFGKVVSGMDVVREIEMSPTHTVGMFMDVPVTPVVITSAERVGE